MRVGTAFNRLLQVPGASVVAVRLEREGVVVSLRRRARRLVCPRCGCLGRAAYDRRERRRWRHLDLGSARCFLECELRRFPCPGCGKVVTEAVAWARPAARFTRDFEAVVAWLAQQAAAAARAARCLRACACLGGERGARERAPARAWQPAATGEVARAVAYVRESTEEQGQGFSPDAQREAIRKFAADNRLALVGEHCDFHSGWRKADARAEFQRLMADAAERRFDMVLVYHTSRFARNQVEARRYKQMLGEDPSDPSAFLTESIHEMFDDYYSVSLSFRTRTGLREKARQGHLVGTLPWGCQRDPERGLAVPEPERAPLVRELFERCAAGQESDRTLAAWLNAKGARSAKGRPFAKDTVRDMLLNAAYCAYVCGLRSKDRTIRGLHEPIVPEELFDRVQQVRQWRARVVKPGRPSDDYLLRKLLYCERCGARMHGTRGSGPPVRRYLCSTRRYGKGCEQPITKAEPLEAQLVEWVSGFEPDEQLRAHVLASIRTAHRRSGAAAERRRELVGQLERLRDLYVMGDLSKNEYVLRRQAPEEELERTGPPIDPRLDKVDEALFDFGRFWKLETEPVERRKLLATLFDRVWQDGGTMVAVKPREPFLRYFRAADELARLREKKRGVISVVAAACTGPGADV